MCTAHSIPNYYFQIQLDLSGIKEGKYDNVPCCPALSQAGDVHIELDHAALLEAAEISSVLRIPVMCVQYLPGFSPRRIPMSTIRKDDASTESPATSSFFNGLEKDQRPGVLDEDWNAVEENPPKRLCVSELLSRSFSN